MATMREAAKKNLEKMVKGAAREVSSSRPGATAQAAVASPESSSRSVSKAVYQQLLDQIAKHGKTIQKVPVDSIRLHENIRETYQAEALQVLINSMEKEGLIQYPTICLKDEGSEPAFVCKNGHRRIMAAKQLGWKTIECIILPFASARDELYHTIAANLREDVFYLDLAAAYQQASRLGESDQAIADRIGVNMRTVSWYRRLTKMSPECQSLCRQHPELFGATWAIKLARQGELPSPAILLKQMQAMLARQQALASGQSGDSKAEITKEQRFAAREQLKQIFGSENGATQVQFAWNLLHQLTQAGMVSQKQLERIRKQYAAGASRSQGRSKSSEKAS